jgi:hypothetical protein
MLNTSEVPGKRKSKAPGDGNQNFGTENRDDQGGGVEPEGNVEPRWWEVGGTGVGEEVLPDSVFSISGMGRPLSPNPPMCLQKVSPWHLWIKFVPRFDRNSVTLTLGYRSHPLGRHAGEISGGMYHNPA